MPTPFTAERYASGCAIVAGGSGGLGVAICRALAEGGSNAALTYRNNRPPAEAVAEEVREFGRKALVAQADLADEAAVSEFVALAANTFGGIHTAIYAAGPYVDMRYAAQIAPEHFRKTVSTDLFGCYNFLHAALPELRKTRGAVVALSSAATGRFLKKDLLSVAPKAAVETIVKAIAAEEGRFGIRANAVGVGVIADGMYHQLRATGDFSDQTLEVIKKSLPLGRLGTAQEIADAVAFLSSDRAGFITGQTLVVDRGYVM
ncbi:MAG TPA: SDR family oxidoreductase [Rhizomicrobium sp.]|jgi:NAD(P)-dependent dehydrogenase (short-subunit alcohol dehydrogenase family)